MTARLSWLNAMDTCKGLGGTLAMLNTFTKNVFVIGNLAPINGRAKAYRFNHYF